jgi:hypothetical protein
LQRTPANEADPQDLLDETHEREIVIYWKNAEFGDINVRLSLGPPEYLAAVEAHLRVRSAPPDGLNVAAGSGRLLT